MSRPLRHNHVLWPGPPANFTWLPIDRDGVPLRAGQWVRVHQAELTRDARVVAVFPESHTALQPGTWVDIDFGDGPQGMPSYILEVLPTAGGEHVTTVQDATSPAAGPQRGVVADRSMGEFRPV